MNKRTITLKNNRIWIRFPYSKVIVSNVKSLLGRRYDPYEKAWSLPFSMFNAINVIDFGRENHFMITDNVFKLAYGKSYSEIGEKHFSKNINQQPVVFVSENVNGNNIEGVDYGGYTSNEISEKYLNKLIERNVISVLGEEPILEDFGINQNKFVAFQKKEKEKILVKTILHIIVFILYLIAAFSFHFTNSINKNEFLLDLGLGLFIYFLPFRIMLSIIDSLKKLKKISTEEIFRKYKEYDNARNLYKSRLLRIQLDYKKCLKEFWNSLSGRRFEEEIADLFRRSGYRAILNTATADQGIDIILQKYGKKSVVQCKAHKKPVGPHVARDLYGSLMNSNANEAFLVSLSGFTTGVEEFCLGKPIRLMEFNNILKMAIDVSEEKFSIRKILRSRII